MLRAATLLMLVLWLSPVSAEAQCDPPLNVIDDGSGALGAVGVPPIVISEIKPGPGGHIEFFNTTAFPQDLTDYWLCSPFTYAQVAGIVPAGGYLTVGLPVSFNDTSAGGEVQLYQSGSFGVSTDILDFVCWGVNPHGSRKNQAQNVGKWSGACAPALTNGAIHRKIGTMGTVAADYDVTAAPSPMNCVPTPANVRDTPPHPDIELAVGPNPFGALATIEYSLSSAAQMEADVFSVSGARVRHLETAIRPAGDGRILWDGTGDDGRDLPSGVYLVRLRANAASVTTRVTLLR